MVMKMIRILVFVGVIWAILEWALRGTVVNYSPSTPLYHIGGLDFFEEEAVNIQLKDGIFSIFTSYTKTSIKVDDILDIKVANVGRISINQSKGKIALSGLLFGGIGAIASSGIKETTKHRRIAEFKYLKNDEIRYFVLAESPSSNLGIIDNVIKFIDIQKEELAIQRENEEVYRERIL